MESSDQTGQPGPAGNRPTPPGRSLRRKEEKRDMFREYIKNMLPDGNLIVTLSARMSNIEDVVRLSSTPGIVETLVREAEGALERDRDAHTMAAILGQANSYLRAMDRRPESEIQEGEEWLKEHFERTGESGLTMLEDAVKEHQDILVQALDEQVSWDRLVRVRSRAAKAYILALSGALEEHVRGISTGDILSDGHRQAAMGLYENIDHLLHHLDENLDWSLGQTWENDLTDRASNAAELARANTHAQRKTITALTTVRFHPSLLSLNEDPEIQRAAEELAEGTIKEMRGTGLVIRGTPEPDPKETIQSFYHNGTLHLKRMSDEYPKGVPAEQAENIAGHILATLEDHAEDHAAEWGDAIIKFADNMVEDATSEIHDASEQSIDLMLETVLGITGHPGAVKSAARIMLSEAGLRHLARRKDLVRVGSPDQVQAIMATAQATGLTPGQLHHLRAFLAGTPGEGMLPETPPGREDTIQVLEMAKEVNNSPSRLIMLADAMGRQASDEDVTTWILGNSRYSHVKEQFPMRLADPDDRRQRNSPWVEGP